MVPEDENTERHIEMNDRRDDSWENMMSSVLVHSGGAIAGKEFLRQV